MYPWVTHTHTHLAGECPHKCSYCYVQAMAKHYPSLKEKYSGPIRLIEKEFEVKYGTGKTIFIENCNDLFADDTPTGFIETIIDHCNQYPDNTYVFQTKNPYRMRYFLSDLPESCILGTTIETNRDTKKTIGNAPNPSNRMFFFKEIKAFRKFVTIEPILDFDIDILSAWMDQIRPEFINIGADSKNHGLPEPSIDKVMELVGKLKKYGIEVREKRNLDRLEA
jgi:DNA repair photolyase